MTNVNNDSVVESQRMQTKYDQALLVHGVESKILTLLSNLGPIITRRGRLDQART